MIKQFAFCVVSLLLITACVPAKKYNDLEPRYDDLKRDWNELSEEYSSLEEEKNRSTNELSALQSAYDEAVAERDQLRRDYDLTKKNLAALQDSYDALEANSSAAIAENLQKNRELLQQLEAKEKALSEEIARLERLQRELEARSQRVTELEELVASKDASMKRLKDAISKALLDFEGKGLTVEQRNGKVYVSMENKLLFDSGSWQVASEGRRAVNELGKVLADNPDISILIEGHTDNVPYRGNAQITDNWDLSTKRATAIVRILRENKQIKPSNLTAAGKGEYTPVGSNETQQGKAKNRRIEIILTPKLDEVTKLLNEL